MIALLSLHSDKIFSGSDGFVLTFKNGVIVPNAGIDTSNIMIGYAILYPENPFQSAQNIKSELQKLFKVNVIKVNTIYLKGKTKLVKGKKTIKSGYKKAIITLKKGQSIDLTAGI